MGSGNVCPGSQRCATFHRDTLLHPRGQTVLRKVHPLVSVWAGSLSVHDSMGIVWLLSPSEHRDIRAWFTLPASPWVSPNGKGFACSSPRWHQRPRQDNGAWQKMFFLCPVYITSLKVCPSCGSLKWINKVLGEMVRSVQTLCWTLMFSELWGNDYKSLGRAKEES